MKEWLKTLGFILVVLVSLVLTGCKTEEVAPGIIEVKVPVRVPCTVETPKLPEGCWQTLDAESDIYVKVRCLMSDRLLDKAYQEQLVTALEACKK